MQIAFHRSVAALAAAAFALLLGVAATTAHAEEKIKTERANGRIVKYDAAASTLTLKDKGKDIVFHVTAEGSVLVRTTVTMNAKPAKLDEIKEGMYAVVYYKQDPADPNKKLARKIDIPHFSEGMEPEEGE